MDITINNNKVIANGTVVSQNDEEILFSFCREVNVKIKFKSGKGNDDRRVDWSVEEGTILVGTFVGFGADQGGVSNRTPIKIGTLNKQEFYINYTLQYIGTPENHTRVFNYSFFVR